MECAFVGSINGRVIVMIECVDETIRRDLERLLAYYEYSESCPRIVVMNNFVPDKNLQMNSSCQQTHIFLFLNSMRRQRWGNWCR